MAQAHIVFDSSLTPVDGTQKIGMHSTRWKAPLGGTWFDITMPGDVFPSGWVLLQGSLIRRGGDYDARLYYDLVEGFIEDQYVEIPISGKGVINELICLPANIKRMKFSPMGTAGEFELSPLTVTKVGALERRWRMAHRIISMIFLHSCQKRKLIKLTFFQMLVNLQGTCKIAGKLQAHASAPRYQNWIKQFDELTTDDRAQINKHISRFANPPYFHLLIVSDGTESGAVQKTLDSLSGQLYRHSTCVLLDMGESGEYVFNLDVGMNAEGPLGVSRALARHVGLKPDLQNNVASANGQSGMNDTGQDVKRVARDHMAAWLEQFNAMLANSKAREWVLLVRAGDVLAPHALYRFACELLAKPEAVVLYSDDDVLGADGQRYQPRFKPDWSLAHFRSTNFVGDAMALRGNEVAKAGGVSLDCCRHGSYDLLLRVVDVVGEAGAGKVAHIPAVLLHRWCAPLPDITSGETTSHLTDKTTSHSTRLSKDDNQVAGYKPANNAGKVIGYSHSTSLSAKKLLAGHPKDDSQVAGYSPFPGGERGFVQDGLPRVERGLDHGNWNDSQWCMEKLREHLVRNGVAGEVSESLPGCWHVRYRLPETPPLVSIIVPTRDELTLIRQCVENLLEKTTYAHFEILVVDNQSAAPDVLAYLEQIAENKKVRVLRYNLPFNYSAMNNMAVREARGEVVCLLNNDTEVISPDWLGEMVGHLLQSKVGVVGAKLYFPNGQVQHGGDLVGIGGVANHAHAFLHRDDPGYCNRAIVAQELSAVTAACLVTWKDIYQRMGGLDEKHLKVAFNDVDYCLRVREAGYHVVWTPHAELYHYESVSRGKDQSPEKVRRARREAAYMRKRWKRVLQRDPFYNPNLSYERPDFSLSNAPTVERPWQI